MFEVIKHYFYATHKKQKPSTNKTYLLLNIRMVSLNKGFNVPTYIYLFMLMNDI